MGGLIKGGFVVILLFAANWYLLRPGLWTFQDASYWPNTAREAFMFLNQPLQAFSNYGYYLGFENGIFVFNRVLVTGVIFGLFHIFGADGSQAMFSLLGNLGALVAFYLFLGLFFTSGKLRYWLSLAYAFHPLVFQLQGHTYFAVCVPLYIYSFVRFVTGDRKKGVYLILNIAAVFVWVAYVRFVQGFALVIIPYLVYLWRTQGWRRGELVEMGKLLLVYLLVLSPTWVAAYFHLRSDGPLFTNYGAVYGGSIPKTDLMDSVNQLYSQIVPVYRDWWWRVAGLTIFAWVVGLLARHAARVRSGLLILNLGLVITAIFIYHAGNILPQGVYSGFVKFFPFVINSPVFALYVLHLPIVMLVGSLGTVDYKSVRVICLTWVLFAILGFWDFSKPELAQLKLNEVPENYRKIWPAAQVAFPQASLYIPRPCWPAKYQTELQVPRPCLNYGLVYSSVRFDDPRLADIYTLDFSNRPMDAELFDKLRFTHNLKNVFVASDFVGDFKQRQSIAGIKNRLDLIPGLEGHENANFTHYSFEDSHKYDYFIYSPSLAVKEGSPVTNPALLPVVSDRQIQSQEVSLFYKYSPDYPERVLIKAENYDPKKELNIQFNQTFSKNWRLAASNEHQFESTKCAGRIERFELTGNRRCLAKVRPIFMTGGLPESGASVTRGNYLSQLWTLPPNPGVRSSGNSDLYLELRYGPKLYIEYAMVGSLLTVLALAVYVIYSLTKEAKRG